VVDFKQPWGEMDGDVFIIKMGELQGKKWGTDTISSHFH